MKMLSLIFGYIGTAASIVGFQLKKQWHIILWQCIANTAVALSYFMLGGSKMAGGAVCMVGGLQTFINFLYIKKDQAPPKRLGILFFFLYAAASLLTIFISGTLSFPYDLLPFLGSVIFLLAVSTKNSTATRMMFFANTMVWIIYDFMANPVAVANLVTHLCLLVSIVVGILRYDVLKKKES